MNEESSRVVTAYEIMSAVNLRRVVFTIKRGFLVYCLNFAERGSAAFSAGFYSSEVARDILVWVLGLIRAVGRRVKN